MRVHLSLLSLQIVAAVMAFSATASGNVFNMGGVRNVDGSWSGLASLETVHVGYPGNAADTRYGTPGYGAVANAYRISKYEVTTGQYCEFLNAVAKTDTYGVYNPSMWSDARGCKIARTGDTSSGYTYSVGPEWANRPVIFVSYWDACRFANWLHNGQPIGPQDVGTTETGAYTLNGYNEGDGRTIQRNTG